MRENEEDALNIPKESEAEYLEGLLKKMRGRILFPEKVERARNMLKKFADAGNHVKR